MTQKSLRDPQPFPIVEIFGLPHGANSLKARRHFETQQCPFAENACEKFRQYGFGYCSVVYAAKDDEGVRHTYAVCDHRLDGDPVQKAVADHFGEATVELVPEVVLTDPRTSFDYVAIARSGGKITDAIAIETQAIDIRGGGVGPAWRAWLKGDVPRWREFFTQEAKQKGRKDNVAYGVNMANIYKRLGLQVATKGAYLKAIGVPFYVVMQDRPFRYLQNRIRFKPSVAGSPWDITFMTFDYTGKVSQNGQLDFVHVNTVRTSLENYTLALSADREDMADQRDNFLAKVAVKSSM